MLPIALTIMLSKLVGDLINTGIYDLHIKLKKFPFLPDEPPPHREGLTATDVMATGVRTVGELERVGTLVKLLKSTTHHGFPVTARGGGGGVLGIILRDQLHTILAKRQFERDMRPASPHLGLNPRAGPAGAGVPLTSDDFLRPWEATTIDELEVRCAPSSTLP